MRIFNGKKIADETLSDLKKKIKKRGFKPKLAVISVGKDLSSELFIRNKKRAAQKIGINVLYYKFKAILLLMELLFSCLYQKILRRQRL